MNFGLIKSGIQLITGFGAGLIADEALKLVKPKNLTGLKKVAVKVGGVVISMMVADKATSYVEEVWDSTAKDIKEFIGPPEVTEETTEEVEES
ncbi:MAG: hypothetical protein RBT15_04765 [Gudongella sp.]|jgi:hypothetical protein|nr:hypothetical protein [Gudongella sp.]